MPPLRINLATLFVALTFFSCSKDGTQVDHSSCLECHQGIEKMAGNHAFECAVCHLLEEHRGKILSDHTFVVRNPSDPKVVERFCLPCHKKEIEDLRGSLHSTMAGIINQTRYLWGAQERAYPYVFGLSGPLERLPEPLSCGYSSPALLVDDFLRRRCLRCHIHTKGPEGKGLYRSSGCAACHVLYDDDGLYKGGDRAIDRGKTGYPAFHSLSGSIPVSQCLRCHNGNRVGSDYAGLFERDYHSNYRIPESDLIYGLDHHKLSADVHSERGLSCTDCHGSQDVMAGKVRKKCPDCHGSWNRKGDAAGVVMSRDGKTHKIPAFSVQNHSHSIEAHTKVRCTACHAQWSFQDYGMSVIREDLVDAYKWRHLTKQGDPLHTDILEKNRENPFMIRPVSRDWVSGESRLGLWSLGWRFRRWETVPLGVDRDERYAVLRPLHQYFISFVDIEGRVVLDQILPVRGDGSAIGWAFMPYNPHTIAPYGRQCDACHLNRLAAGFGSYDGPEHDLQLMIPSPPIGEWGRLLSEKERKNLIYPSIRFKKERAKALGSEGQKD